MTNLKNLKRSSQSAASFDNAKKQAEGYTTSSKSYKDERYWQPVVDGSNNGSAIIRFLPGILIPNEFEIGANGKPVTDDDGNRIPKFEEPFVRKWSHGFKGPKGMWYIENNLNTIDQEDPCTKYNSQLWNTKDPENIAQAKRQRRKLAYVSNILVIKHAARPSDEGKVFLYSYGKKVFDKIMGAMFPPEDDIDPVDVFDFWKGANFRLRIKEVEGFRNYDTSAFDQPTPLSSDDNELEEIFNQEHSLRAEIAPNKFKSYAELEKRLNEVLDLSKDTDELPSVQPRAPRAAAPVEEDYDGDDQTPAKAATPATTGDAKAFFAKLKKQEA